MKRGITVKRIAMLFAGCLFAYVASFGPVIMKGGIGKGSWYNLMDRGLVSNRGAAIAEGWRILVYYEPIFWMCEKSPAFERIMSSYVGRCYSLYY
jgi:hypothetical protein